MTKRERMYEQIQKHGENLKAIFPWVEDEPVKLCKKLHSLEYKAHRATTCLCNTNTLHLLELNKYTGYDVKQTTDEEEEIFFGKIISSLDKILKFKEHNVPVFINFDPRGYALKIKNDYVSENNLKIYQDLGGYGILAPEFDGNN